MPTVVVPRASLLPLGQPGPLRRKPSSSRSDFTSFRERQMNTYARMRAAATLEFDPSSHALLLEQLSRYVPSRYSFEAAGSSLGGGVGPGSGAGGEAAKAWRSPLWTRLGFQGDDPTTDFRGAGVMGLSHLVALLSSGKWPPVTESAWEEVALAGFPLAVASINVTGFLQSYFGVNPRVASPVHQRHRCTERALFEVLSRGGFGPLQSLHSDLVCHVYRIWAEAPRSPMDFPKVLAEACADFHATVSAISSSSVGEAGAVGLHNVGDALAARRPQGMLASLAWLDSSALRWLDSLATECSRPALAVSSLVDTLVELVAPECDFCWPAVETRGRAAPGARTSPRR